MTDLPLMFDEIIQLLATREAKSWDSQGRNRDFKIECAVTLVLSLVKESKSRALLGNFEHAVIFLQQAETHGSIGKIFPSQSSPFHAKWESLMRTVVSKFMSQ